MGSSIWCHEQLANCGASVFHAQPTSQRLQEGPAEGPARAPAARREAQRLQGEADAALAEDREDRGEGAGDEGISCGIAYGFL